MTWTKRLAPLAVAVAVGVSGAALPASAATVKPKAWTTKHCQSYKTAFLKAHKKPTKAQLAAANKVLKSHGCKIKA